MGDFEKLRVEEIKLKKARDDKLNRKVEMDKKHRKTTYKDNQIRDAN